MFRQQLQVSKMILTLCLSFLLYTHAEADTLSEQQVKAQHQRACLNQFPHLLLATAVAEKQLKIGLRVIQEAGEHPTVEAVEQIVKYLGSSGEAGLLGAQLSLGMYVVGYWFTDEIFWPDDIKVATHALAMLRVAALRLHDLGPPHDPLLKALALTPPQFDDQNFELPEEWLSASLQLADQWLSCEHIRRHLDQ